MITVQINQLAKRFDLPESEELYNVLKATAFKGDVSDAQLSALLIVAKQYSLNPWIKQIYAFPDKNNGIVPVVGVDGWTHIINSHPQYDGVEFDQDAESCTCIIYRKDRSHPTKVTEYMSECKRNVGPWVSHPRRMLRHKALIQCARLAFGFSGIYDTDEAERIVENQQYEPKVIDPSSGEIKQAEPLPVYSNEEFQKNLVIWKKVIASGKKDIRGVLATISSIATLNPEQLAIIEAIKEPHNDITDLEPKA
jgi:phage recombination protein Bet